MTRAGLKVNGACGRKLGRKNTTCRSGRAPPPVLEESPPRLIGYSSPAVPATVIESGFNKILASRRRPDTTNVTVSGTANAVELKSCGRVSPRRFPAGPHQPPRVVGRRFCKAPGRSRHAGQPALDGLLRNASDLRAAGAVRWTPADIHRSHSAGRSGEGGAHVDATAPRTFSPVSAVPHGSTNNRRWRCGPTRNGRTSGVVPPTSYLRWHAAHGGSGEG